VPRTRRWTVSTQRKVTSFVLVLLATFLLCAGIGAASWVAAAIGVALAAAGAALYGVSALNSREYVYVPGTARVQSASPAPASVAYGRCELLLIVHAPGMDDVAVRTRETRVPVAKWPHEGAILPILVAITDRRRIRVLWDQVRSHGEVAEQQLADEGYLDDDEAPEVALDGLFDADGGEDLTADELNLAGIDPTSRVIEMDLVDPAVFGPVSPTVRRSGGAPGDQESAGVDEAPGSRESIEVELSPMVQETGAGALGASTDEGRRPSPRPRPRRSPSPRRPLHDELDGTLDTATVMTAGPLVNPAVPVRPETTPQGPVAEPVVDFPETGTLRVDHVVPVDPGVPAMPGPAATGDPASSDDAAISDAYLLAATPPGQVAARRVRGVGVTLFVSNLARSIDFYRDTLGFSQVDEGLGSAVLESGDSRIVLRRVADMAPVDRRLVHLLLEVPDVQAAYDDLRARGVTFVHRPRAVSRYEQLELWSAAFRDPDGHGIALIRWELRQPRSTEPRT
jgi:resuscitation-promoting factor RpfA